MNCVRQTNDKHTGLTKNIGVFVKRGMVDCRSPVAARFKL